MFEDTAFSVIASIGVGTLALLGAATVVSLMSSARREEVRPHADTYRTKRRS